MTGIKAGRPQRGFVQTPAIIAVRLGIFAVLLLLAYQARLYDEEGRLCDEARPRWEKTEDGYGRVCAEIS